MSDLEAILELGDLDRRLAPVKRRLDQTGRLAAPQEHRASEAKAALAALDEKIKQATLQIKTIEGEAKAKQAEIDKSQVSLNQCKSNDEYQALTRQIGQRKQELGQIETQLLEAMFAQETRQSERGTLAGRQKELETELKAAHGRAGQEKQKIDAERKGLEDQRAAIVAKLGPEAKELYTRIIERLGDTATAEVIDENCQGCFMKVRPEQLSQLRARNQLITCFTCGRILFRNL